MLKWITDVTSVPDELHIVILKPFSAVSLQFGCPTLHHYQSKNCKLSLCIATGRVKMISTDHLHEETKVILVQDHLSLHHVHSFFARTLYATDHHNVQ